MSSNPPERDLPPGGVESSPMREAGSPSPAPWTSPILRLAVIALISVEVYFYWTSVPRTTEHLYLGMFMIFLAFFPSLRWIAKAQASLPIFEVFLLTCANIYAFPLLNGHKELIRYSDENITRAALTVVLFQGVAIAVYEMTRANASLSRFWREEVISGDVTRWVGHALVLNTVYVLLSNFTDLIPSSINSVLRAVFFGIGTIATFITARRLGARELSNGETIFFVTNLVIQCIGMMSTLFLVGAVSLLLLALVGYASSGHRVPLVSCLVAVTVIAVLHNGKDKMREKYWESQNPRPSFLELPAFYAEWFQLGLFSEDTENKRAKITGKLIDRTSLFHILCLVVSSTPDRDPYLDGETYRDVPAQFVPRILWPDKPLSQVSTSRLSVYYGLQTEEDTQRTSIGFGLLPEAYANFGFIGVCCLAAAFAFVVKKLQCWAVDAPIFSYGGLLLVILLAWSFQVEFTLSIWLSSFYQACMAVLGIPFLLRRIF